MVPKRVTIETIERLLRNGSLSEHEETVIIKSDLNHQEQERRDYLWDLLKEVLLDEPAIYDRSKRTEHLKRIEAESGIKRQNLYRYLSRYWKDGQTPDTLIPHYEKRGAKGRTRVATDKKLGRGISITEEEWPCRHIPSAILGDRGEMESRNADNLVSMLGIRIENAPPYRADLKGIIEQHFRTINTNATVFLPGRVKPDMAERGGRDYRLDAKLDIRQFTAIIIKCVLYYNNSHYMESFEKNKQKMEAGVEAVPLKLWNWGIRYCSGALRTVPEEKVKLALMPTEKANVTSRGIRFKGLYYSSQEMIDGLWFEKARSKGSYRVKVSYDPRDMGDIYVWDKSGGPPLPCSLLGWEEKYAGKQLLEVQYEQEKEKQEKKRHQAQETEAKINLGREIDSIIKGAEQMAEPVDGRSKAERLSGIRQNRKEEREQIRKQEAFTSKGETVENNRHRKHQRKSPLS